MPNFRPDNKQESDFGGQSKWSEILIPISEIWQWFKNRNKKPEPDDGQLNTEEIEKIRQNKIDEKVDAEMAEVCGEDPEMRNKLKNT